MNDKEIEAIRLLNYCVNNNMPLPEEALSWVKITLEYIDKLEQKIEKLTKEYKARIADNLKYKDYMINSIHKNRIRNKIKDYENFKELGRSSWDNTTDYDSILKVLQELLEEE